MTTIGPMEQAMKDAVDMAGGRIDREDFFTEVQAIRSADGQETSASSIRTNTMKAHRLTTAGLTRVQIPSLGIDEIWDAETAQNYLDGAGTGGAQNNFGLTGGTGKMSTTASTEGRPATTQQR